VERQANNHKFAKPWFNSQCGRSLCCFEKTLNAVSHLQAKQSTQCGGPLAQPDERHVNRAQHLCWSGMTDIEHSATSGSNEEDCACVTIIKINISLPKWKILDFFLFPAFEINHQYVKSRFVHSNFKFHFGSLKKVKPRSQTLISKFLNLSRTLIWFQIMLLINVLFERKHQF